MKKIKIIFLLVFSILIGFFCCSNVNAETARVKTKGIGAYYHGYKTANGNWVRYGQLQSFYIANGQYANARTYCIAPGEVWYSTKDYSFIYFSEGNAVDKINGTQDKTENILTQEQLNLISQYAYYGHGYGNHDSNIYIVATQMLIYRVFENQVFTNINCANGNCSKINDPAEVSEAMVEIQSLVDNHFKRPSFNSNLYQLALGESITITDTNQVLNNYEVVNCKNCFASISGYNLTITATAVDDVEITLKKHDYYENEVMFLTSSESQNMIVPGNLDPIVSNVYGEVYTGMLEIFKTDETKTKKLENAKYEVFDSFNNKVCEIKTNSEGYGKCDNLKMGDYILKEIEPPVGYVKDDKVYNFSITESKTTITLSLTNEMIKGYVEIYKLDSDSQSYNPQGEATLTGAEYYIYTEDGTLVEKLIVDENSYAKSGELKFGKYYLLEYKAPVGYTLDKTKHYFEITENKTTITLKLSDQVIKGRIRVNKYDSETNSCNALGQASLKGAKFNVIDHNNNVVDTITIGDDCTATTKYLPYGKYIIKEVSAPKEYYLTTEIKEQFISEKKDYSVTVKNDVIKNFISILKQYDYVNGNTTFLNAEANITFEILYPDGTKYGEIKTDKNGYATIEIPYGVWKFHQVNSNTGFEKIYDFYITVDENSEKEHYYNILNNKISAYLQVFKKDSETGKTIAIANTKFKILNTDTNQYVSQYVGGKVYDNFLTDENGTFTTYLKLEAGNYKLVEVESPKGYLISNDGLNFTIGEDTEYNYTTYGAIVVVNFKNTPIKGQVEIFKNGEKFVVKDGTFKYQDIKLAGIKFNLYAEEDIKTPDGNYLYYNKGDLVEMLITNEDGYIKSQKLPLGKYYLVEVETKDNFVLNEKEYHFELTQKDNRTAIVLETYKAFNYLKKGMLEFTKTDYTTSEPIPNVEFKIFTENDKMIYSGKTDKNGKIVIKELAVGKYYIVEESSIEGYVSPNEKVLFEIKENGEIVKAKMTNKKITSTLKITKNDEDGKLLSGIKFGVYNLEDKLISEHITDENGYFEVVLEYGRYYLKEISTLNPYVLNTKKVYFEVKEEGAIIEKTVTNNFKTGMLEFTKTDLVNGEVIPNTLIEIYNSNDELVFSGKTDEKGKIIVEELKYGKYYIVEKEATTGYVITSEKVYFEITKDGEIVKAKMTNEKISGKLSFMKIDEEGNPLAGVTINLYDLENNLIGTYITSETGLVIIEDLEYGDYMIKEVATVDGYELSDEVIYVSIVEDGAEVNVSMINKKLPQTDMNDYSKIVALSLIGLGSILLIITLRKKKKQ